MIVKYIRLFFLIVLFLNVGIVNAQQKKTKRPNIIFILADDLGYGDVGCYGQKIIATPNLDKLSASGMKFTQFYSGSTVCAPARTTLMTGLHTGHTPIRGNRTMQPEGQFPLPDSSGTFVQLLKADGYNTGAFGKWSLGFLTTTGSPDKKGFDRFYGYNCQSLAHNYYPDHLWDNDQRIDFPENATKHNAYSGDLIHQQAISFIKQQSASTPFFLYLPYTLPHADLSVPHDSIYDYYVKLINEKPAKKPAKWKDSSKLFEPFPLVTFAAMVARLDKYVGEIVATVNRQHLLENTIIIFASDNGPHKEDGHDPAYFNSNAGFRGIKRDLYEGGIREPFIVSWKGKVKAGTINQQPCILYDLFPTFLEAAGLPSVKNRDGISIMPSLLGKKQLQHHYLYWELHESGGRQAIRMGNWKAVKLNVSTIPDPAIELYDLASDPYEKNNLAAAKPEIIATMKFLFREAHIYNKDWVLLKDEAGSPVNND